MKICLLLVLFGIAFVFGNNPEDSFQSDVTNFEDSAKLDDTDNEENIESRNDMGVAIKDENGVGSPYYGRMAPQQGIYNGGGYEPQSAPQQGIYNGGGYEPQSEPQPQFQPAFNGGGLFHSLPIRRLFGGRRNRRGRRNGRKRRGRRNGRKRRGRRNGRKRRGRRNGRKRRGRRNGRSRRSRRSFWDELSEDTNQLQEE